MLLVYPIIILCFNFVSIYGELPNTKLEKNRTIINFASRNIRSSETKTTTEVLGLDDISDLYTSKPINEIEPKKNVSRIRRLKRKRVVNKTIVPVDIITSVELKQPKMFTVSLKNSDEKENVDKNLISNSDEKENVEQNIGDMLKQNSASSSLTNSATNKITKTVQDKTVFEKKLNQNKEDAINRRTFPKRPAEFNPIFKKRRERDPITRIIDEKNYVYGHNGNFHFSFEGGDGTKVFSKGNLLSTQQKKAGEAVVGGYFYKDGDGNDYSLSYTADEHGYQPVGAHLPTPPPIPPAIARALEYLATKPNPEPTEKYYS